jgi:hypothetical protein
MREMRNDLRADVAGNEPTQKRTPEFAISASIGDLSPKMSVFAADSVLIFPACKK